MLRRLKIALGRPLRLWELSSEAHTDTLRTLHDLSNFRAGNSSSLFTNRYHIRLEDIYFFPKLPIARWGYYQINGVIEGIDTYFRRPFYFNDYYDSLDTDEVILRDISNRILHHSFEYISSHESFIFCSSADKRYQYFKEHPKYKEFKDVCSFFHYLFRDLNLVEDVFVFKEFSNLSFKWTVKNRLYRDIQIYVDGSGCYILQVKDLKFSLPHPIIQKIYEPKEYEPYLKIILNRLEDYY